MRDAFIRRTTEFQRRMADKAIDAALLTDPDSIYYLAGYWGYLGVEFGRPTALVVPREGPCTVVTPKMEAEMARRMTWIEDVREWSDGAAGEWAGVLADILGRGKLPTLGIERQQIPPAISRFLAEECAAAKPVDVAGILGAMRMIKDPDEIAVMRQAGHVALAMAEAAEAAIAEDVPEYEVALAVIGGGTRKAAEFLTEDEADRFVSPTIHNLQILQSGHDTCMVHRRSTVRRIRRGDPVYLCFCRIANFKQYKLGFDREFFVGAVSGEQARIYEVALGAQAAALGVIRPGVIAEDVNAAAEEVYRSAGFEAGYRTGRAIGCSFLEQPELKAGDKTVLRAGMTFAVDGGITVPGEFGARIGDSIVVTESGYEDLTPYPKDLRVL